jgi:hypothetical protein
LVDEVVPLTVQGHDGAVVHTDQKRFHWWLADCRQ